MSDDEEVIVDAAVDAELEALGSEMDPVIEKLAKLNPAWGRQQLVTGAVCFELAKLRIRLRELESKA